MSLDAGMRARLFFRLMSLQARWTFAGMQSEGFAFAIDPWLERCWPEPAALASARARHREFFNTNPYAAGLVLGAACRLEEEAAAAPSDRAARVEKARALKKALASALAAIGDALFWGAMRPFCAALALAVFVLSEAAGPGGAAGPVCGAAAYLATFAAFSSWFRWKGLAWGYEWGERLPEKLAQLRLQARIAALRRGGLALAAVSGLALAVSMSSETGAGMPIVLAGLAVFFAAAAARGTSAVRLFGWVLAGSAAAAAISLIARWRGL